MQPARRTMESLHDQGTGLTHREALPLRVRSVSSPPDSVTLRQQYARNEMLLRVSIALQDHHEVEERSEFSTELARMDLKLDLLISIVQQLVTAKQSLPTPVPITLTAEGISWPLREGAQFTSLTDEPPQAPFASPVVAELFVNPVVPMPLCLYGKLSQVKDEDGEPCWQVIFDAPGEAIVDLLEKLIFRYHRRAVAMGINP